MPRAVRPEVHRRRQRRAPAGRHPPGDLRQLRALHRAPDRALRRAPSRCGWRPCRPSCCRSPTATRLRAGRCATAWPAAGLRVELDDRQEKIGYKIREAQLQKVPYMLVVGDREAAEGTVAVRSRSGGDQGAARTCRDAVHRSEARRRGGAREAGSSARDGVSGGRVCAVSKEAVSLRRGPRRDDRIRINERIRVREMRVIDDTGQQLGIMPPQQALAIARQKGLDLVEISPTAQPPVCRIMDFGQVPVPGTEARARGQEAPEDHRGQGDQVPARRSTSTTTSSRRSTSSASWKRATR